MSDTKSLYVFCQKCHENILVDIETDAVEKMASGITSVLSVHGNPQHAALIYVDKNYMVRGVEYPSSLEIEKTVTTVVESTRTSYRQEYLSFSSLVDLFGKKRKEAVWAFSRIITQAFLGGSVYIVHDSPTTASTVVERLQEFFTEDVHIAAVTHDQVKSLSPSDCVYSIQTDEFISEGNSITTKTLEKMVVQCLKDESSFFRFKLDLSKLAFAYRNVKGILAEQKGKIKDTEIAKKAKIEVENVPFLLEMAESEGMDVSGVIHNGLSRIARGF